MSLKPKGEKEMLVKYTPTRPAYLSYYQDRVGKFRWRLVSSNGKTICASSQGYITEIDCCKNAQLVGQLLSQHRATYAKSQGRIALFKPESP